VRALTVAVAGALALGCGDEGRNGAGQGNAENPPVTPNPDEYLASFVSELSAPGGAVIDLPEQDPAVTLSMPPPEIVPFIPVIPLEPGGMFSFNIGYEAANANVVAAGVGFSSVGPILRVPQESTGAGAILVSVGIPENLCQHIGPECRRVTSYAYAITAEGKVSAPFVFDAATECGPCTEPTCGELLPLCSAASP
jgi:hypothetical protein